MELVRGVLRLPPHGYALDDRLREIGYGQWEGSTLREMEESHPELFAERQADKWGVPPPGGESYASVQLRDARLVQFAVAATRSTVAHGGTMRALMVALGLEAPQSASEI